ncbi:hypothetical protein HS125_09745 [bacterium]|nr:hypothetical protein [bacterium]
MVRRATIVALLMAVNWCARAETTLSVSGGRFVVNGTPTFLLGVSYYGGLGASRETLLADLDDLQRLGFNWMRVWATWLNFVNVAALTPDGRPRQPYLDRLVWLVGECDRRNFVVDVTLHRHRSEDAQRMLPDLASHLRAVETIVLALRSHRNWYLDLANERDIRDARFVSFEELRRLRDRVKELDPDRLVTASGAPKQDDLDEYLGRAKLDFVSPHLPRNAASPGQTAGRVRQLAGWMEERGRTVPIHLQEPFRRGYGEWQPKAEDFLTDLEGARAGGAAGWCFHNGAQRGAPDQQPRRSFDLTRRRLFQQWDGEERRFLELLLRPR